jgi:hypothetical protein
VQVRTFANVAAYRAQDTSENHLSNAPSGVRGWYKVARVSSAYRRRAREWVNSISDSSAMKIRVPCPRPYVFVGKQPRRLGADGLGDDGSVE